MRELEKKIDTLRHIKKKKELSAKRSHSKVRETQAMTASIETKANIGTFKKKDSSAQKILKKTQSDKHLIRPPHPPKPENPLSVTNPHQ